MWKGLPGRPRAAESPRFLALCVSDGARRRILIHKKKNAWCLPWRQFRLVGGASAGCSILERPP
jgi:hypothetical protein